MFTIMVAIDRKGAIGRGNTLPWSLPNDLKQFKQYTEGKPVLMGYKTALSIGRALPNRTNLVLSRNHEAPYPGQIHLSSLADVLHYHMRNGFREIVVCGGAEIYKAILPYAQKLILTRVDTVVEDADTFFMTLEQLEMTRCWNINSKIYHHADDKHQFDFSIRTYYHSSYAPDYTQSPILEET